MTHTELADLLQQAEKEADQLEEPARAVFLRFLSSVACSFMLQPCDPQLVAGYFVRLENDKSTIGLTMKSGRNVRVEVHPDGSAEYVDLDGTRREFPL